MNKKLPLYIRRVEKEKYYPYVINFYDVNFRTDIEALTKKLPSYIFNTIKPSEIKELIITQEELMTSPPLPIKKGFSLQRTQEFYIGNIVNIIYEYVAKGKISKEKSHDVLDGYVLGIKKFKHPEDIKHWYEDDFVPEIEDLDIKSKYTEEIQKEPIQTKHSN